MLFNDPIVRGLMEAHNLHQNAERSQITPLNDSCLADEMSNFILNIQKTKEKQQHCRWFMDALQFESE
jgi:hypothetical protein